MEYPPVASEVQPKFGLSSPTTYWDCPRGDRVGIDDEGCGLPEHLSLLLAEVQMFPLQ